MDDERFRHSAEAALNALPDQFLQLMENVVIVTNEFAEPSVLADLGIDSPWELLGLYEGHPITEREAVASGVLPDMIHLYRRPILVEAETAGISPEQCIRETLIHEIGHHFGFSDAEMALFEREEVSR